MHAQCGGRRENAIRAFAGDEVLKPGYCAEDREFLLDFEDGVQHYTVAARASEPV